MSSERPKPATTPCLCNALRQADRAVSRLYDEELRGVGLRTTQYSLLRWLRHAGEVRQRDLGALTSLDETTAHQEPPPPDRRRLGRDPSRGRSARETC